jgi:hypothetical protein
MARLLRRRAVPSTRVSVAASRRALRLDSLRRRAGGQGEVCPLVCRHHRVPDRRRRHAPVGDNRLDDNRVRMVTASLSGERLAPPVEVGSTLGAMGSRRRVRPPVDPRVGHQRVPRADGRSCGRTARGARPLRVGQTGPTKSQSVIGNFAKMSLRQDQQVDEMAPTPPSSRYR